MESLIDTLKNNRVYFIAILLWIIAGGILTLNLEKGEFLIHLNQQNKPFLNLFFEYFTHLGDGLFFLAIGILIALKKTYRGLIVLTSFAFSGILAQILKHSFQLERPSKFFTDKSHLIIPEYWDLHTNFSFPSGHTTTAFCLATILVLVLPLKNVYKLLIALAAMLAGISRVYLLQHFLMDIYFGSILGAISALLIYHSMKQLKHSQKAWLNKSWI